MRVPHDTGNLGCTDEPGHNQDSLTLHDGSITLTGVEVIKRACLP